MCEICTYRVSVCVCGAYLWLDSAWLPLSTAFLPPSARGPGGAGVHPVAVGADGGAGAVGSGEGPERGLSLIHI